MAFLRVILKSTQFGQLCNNVMLFQDVNDVPWSPTLADALAVDLRDGWIALVRPRINVNVKWWQIEVRDAQNPATQPRQLPTNILGVQASNASMSPAITALIMRFRTGTAGPSGRGRIYMPGPPLGDFNSGLMIQTAIDGWNIILASLFARYCTQAATSGFKLRVGPRSSALASKEVIGLEISNLLGTQKRRNIGVGT